jgi:hypothetical protein
MSALSEQVEVLQAVPEGYPLRYHLLDSFHIEERRRKVLPLEEAQAAGYELCDLCRRKVEKGVR